LYNLEVLDLSYNRLMAFNQTIFGENFLYKLRVFNFQSKHNQTQLSTFNIFFTSTQFDVINLRGQSFTDIPDIIISTAHRVDFFDLSRNKITRIRKQYFENTAIVFDLTFSENLIQAFDSTALKTLNSLILLNLSYNRIISISSEILTGLFNLETLDLSNNFITSIYGHMFSDSKYLKFLSLKNNMIKTVTNTFPNNKMLKYIYINQNPVRNLFRDDSLYGMESLKFYYISNMATISYNVCLILISNLHLSSLALAKRTYYKSINIVVESDSQTDTQYAPEQCYYMTFLIRNNLHFNLVNDWDVDKYVSDCSGWISRTNREVLSVGDLIF
jgi:hypothetical protein